MMRDIRLQALAESPDSFRDTVDAMGLKPDEYWDQMVDDVAGRDRAESFVAECEGQAIGILFVGVDTERVGHIGAMWVHPTARRQGIAGRLLSTAVAFARERDAETVELWVPVANQAAQSLYRQAGFAPSGESMMLREDSDVEVIAMRIIGYEGPHSPA